MSVTRDKIIATALEHLSRKGYAGISMRDIAEDVGIKAASIYNHFNGKKDLVQAVYVYIEQVLSSDLLKQENVETTCPQRQFGSLWNTWFKEYRKRLHTVEYQNIIRLLSIEQYADASAARLILEYMIERPMKIAENIVRRYIRKSSSFNARELAAEFFYPLFGMMHELILRISHNQKTTHIEHRMNVHIDFFRRLLREEK